jgi:hypothetical protein
MSRIDRPRVEDGDSIEATDLNSRFTDYSQPGALNAFNVRETPPSTFRSSTSRERRHSASSRAIRTPRLSVRTTGSIPLLSQ